MLTALVMAAPIVEADDADRLRRAVESVQKAQLPSGLLRYDFDFQSGAPSGEDHPARQASVVAVLSEYLLVSRDSSVRDTVARALARFEALSLPIGKSRAQRLVESSGLYFLPRGRHTLARALDRLGLMYRPDGEGAVLSLDGQYREAWVGGTARALFAELMYAEATGDERFDAARARWLRGLAALYVPGLGFRAAPTLIHVTTLSDGQAWLALAHHERRRPADPVVASMLPELEARLMREQSAAFDTYFYQWGTMAAAVRWDSTRDSRFPAFIEQQAVSVLDEPEEPEHYNTCAMVEGLATAARVLRDAGGRSALVRRIVARVEGEMRKNYALQIRPVRGRFAVAHGVSIVSPRLAEFDGAFLMESQRPYIRIDMTDHCISAMLKLRQLSSSR